MASRLITCRRSARRRRCRRRSKNSTNSCWAPIALSGLRLSSVSVSRLTSSLVSWVWARPAFLARPTRKCTAAAGAGADRDRRQGQPPGDQQAQEQHDDGLDRLGHELRRELVGLLRPADLAAEGVGDPAGRVLEQVAPARAQHLLDQAHAHQVRDLGVGVADLAHDVERDHRLEQHPDDQDDDQRAQRGIEARGRAASRGRCRRRRTGWSSRWRRPSSGTSVAKPIPSHRLATIRQTSTTQGLVPRALKKIRRTLFTLAHPLGETDGRIARPEGSVSVVIKHSACGAATAPGRRVAVELAHAARDRVRQICVIGMPDGPPNYLAALTVPSLGRWVCAVRKKP